MRLSLHKGGCVRIIKGTRRARLRLCLPATSGAFDVNHVVKPAYQLNYPPVLAGKAFTALPLALPEAENILVETIKPVRMRRVLFIVRLYEAEAPLRIRPCGSCRRKECRYLQHVGGTAGGIRGFGEGFAVLPPL